MSRDLPAFVEVPVLGGGSITATVAARQGISEVILNGVPHIGLLLSVNTVSATLAVMDPNEALRCAGQLQVAAITLAKRLGREAEMTRQRRDVTGLQDITRLHADDIGAHEFDVIDDAGQPVQDVLEVNADEGWILQLNKDEEGAPITNDDGYTYIRVRGNYTIRRRNS